MGMSDKQRDLVLQKITPYFGKRTCELCGSEGWFVADNLVNVNQYHGRDLVLGGGQIPLLSVHCRKCGNTKLLNAIVLGLIDESTGEWKDG
jgi:hypothetical protein